MIPNLKELPPLNPMLLSSISSGSQEFDQEVQRQALEERNVERFWAPL